MYCIVSKHKLAEGASFCAECSYYQNPWLNRVRYNASVIGLLTLFASLVIFCITKIPEVKTILWPNKSIKVVQLAISVRNRHLSIYNSGDSEIWISDVRIIGAEVKEVLDGHGLWITEFTEV